MSLISKAVWVAMSKSIACSGLVYFAVTFCFMLGLMLFSGFFLLFLFPAYAVAVALDYYILKQPALNWVKKSKHRFLLEASIIPASIFSIFSFLEITFILSKEMGVSLGSIGLILYLFIVAWVVFYLTKVICYAISKGKSN